MEKANGGHRQLPKKWQIINLISPKREIKILMELVNLRVVKCNFRNPKVINRYLRKSNIIPDVVLTTLPFWEPDLNTILVFEIM